MIPHAGVDFFLSDETRAVNPESPLWAAPFPLDRQPAGARPSRPDDRPLTYGDYFGAADRYLRRDKARVLVAAAARVLGRPVGARQIEAVRVFLAKHGQYYHPARVEVSIGGVRLCFVLNVAVSEAGRRMIKQECCALTSLKDRYPYRFVPEVYARGGVDIGPARCFDMFLGQWFDGYHEFHLSRPAAGRPYGLVVWDDVRGNFFLSDGQARTVYRQAAKILTGYYNLATFEQIFSWHHAAGDFVIRCGSDGIDTRLVTVRQYAPLLGRTDVDARVMLEALQIFLLNLSLRMCLDRLDGVGEFVWAGEGAVAGGVAGFFEGLRLQVRSGLIPDELVEGCRDYFGAISCSEWFELARAVVARYDPAMPELRLVQKQLENHVACFYETLRKTV